MIFTTQDITPLKVAEARLQLSEYSIDQAGEAILWIASDGQLVRANPAACHLLNYREDELLEMSHFLISDDLDEKNWKSHWTTLATEGSHVQRTRWQRRDGRSVPVEVASSFFTFEGTDYIMAFARDLTEITETEERAKAQERLAAIGQLAAGIAHDLNNIMAGIILYAQMLRHEERMSSPSKPGQGWNNTARKPTGALVESHRLSSISAARA